jgi:hypothetical protein
MVSIVFLPLDFDIMLIDLRLLHRQRVMCDLRRDNVLGIHQACGVEATGSAFTSVEDDGIALHISAGILVLFIRKQPHWTFILFQSPDS